MALLWTVVKRYERGLPSGDPSFAHRVQILLPSFTLPGSHYSSPCLGSIVACSTMILPQKELIPDNQGKVTGLNAEEIK